MKLANIQPGAGGAAAPAKKEEAPAPEAAPVAAAAAGAAAGAAAAAIPSTPPPAPASPAEPMKAIPVAAIRHAKALDPPKTSGAGAAPIVRMPPADPTKEIAGTRSEHRVKMNRMRLKIADRLKEAQNTNAMLTTFNEVDMR